MAALWRKQHIASTDSRRLASLLESHEDNKTMNWELIGAVSEVVGALGIIVTLAYLAVQVRQNSVHLAESAKLAESSQLEATSNIVVDWRKMLLMNPDLLELQNRGMQSYLTLDPIDRMKFDQLIRIIFLQSQTMYLQHLLFRRDPDDYNGGTRKLEYALQKPGVREWLSESETDWRPEFRVWIESAIERIDRDKGV